MLRISAVARTCIGTTIAAAFCVSSAAQTNQPKDFTQQAIHRSYPALPVLAGLACRSVITADNAASKFCAHLVLAGLFAAGDEFADALVKNDVTNSTRDAHTIAAFPPLAAGYVFGGYDTFALSSRASGINQLGRSYREVVKDQPTESQIMLKGTGAAVTLATLAATFQGRNPGESFFTATGVAGVYTGAYMLREAAIDGMKNLTSHLPELKVAAVLSTVGAVGMALTTPFQMPFFVATAILESGAVTAADEAIKGAESIGFQRWAAHYIVALAGTLLYIPNAKANTPAKRIVANVGQAFLLPAAFTLTYETARNLMSSLSKE